MNIKTERNDNLITVALDGSLDTGSAPDLEKIVEEQLDGITDIVFDFNDLEYISSAGLRVLLAAQRKMNKVGTMKIRGTNEVVMEIFEVTGFVDILDIE